MNAGAKRFTKLVEASVNLMPQSDAMNVALNIKRLLEHAAMQAVVLKRQMRNVDKGAISRTHSIENDIDSAAHKSGALIKYMEDF